jgi:methyl-accepting chemotaxis protein
MSDAATVLAQGDEPVEQDRTFIKAVKGTFAAIEFDGEGQIQAANAVFLSLMGYAEDEILGRHHGIFVDPREASSLPYRRFWEALRAGEPQTREFMRLAKDGRPVWIRASYMPLRGRDGKVYRIVKLAQDSTSEHAARADLEGKRNAISRAQAVIEFGLDGTILDANENFLAAVGYSLEEIRGRHHSLFVDGAYARSSGYRDFWRKLNNGEYASGEFRRLGKGGREIWIQASYNPIFGLDGKPCKVVKYAIDVTEQKLRNADFESQIEAIHKAQAVITFQLDGADSPVFLAQF